MNELPDAKKSIIMEHHWSGWPGAYCLHCGHDDPMEYAIGNCLYDPFTKEWASDQDKEDFEAANACFATEEAIQKCPQCQSKKAKITKSPLCNNPNCPEHG